MIRISRRTVLHAPFIIAALGVLAVGGTAYSFVRLTTGDNVTGLHWASSPARYTIQSAGSKDVPDQSGAQAIRLAFATWSAVDGSGERLVEDPTNSNMAKVHANDGVNLVFFDETNATGLFTGADFIIAITPVFFDGSGALLDADIVFNGFNHSFSTDLRGGTYDVQNIATHEAGHFLGLDHTGIYGATMIPFAFEQDVRLRSLEKDDISGLTTIYPTALEGRLTGAIVLDGGTAPDGAHVVAVNVATGEPQSGTLTLAGGGFSIEGVLPGQYHVYVEPLDGPVSGANLQRGSVTTGFTTAFAGGVATPSVFSVAPGQAVAVGTIHVQSRSGFNLSGVIGGQSQVLRGSSVIFQVTGDGLQLGLTVEVPGPGVHLASGNRGVLDGNGGFPISVDANAPTGLHDIYVYRNGGTEMVALPGGLEVRAAAPTVATCAPSSGPTAGGQRVTIAGANFRAGARVVMGDQIATQVNVTSDTSIQATTPGQTAAGAARVVVINPDGQQGTATNAYTFAGAPAPPPPPSSAGTSGGTSAGGGASAGGSTGGGTMPTGGSSGGGGGGGGGGGCAIAARAPTSALLPYLLGLAALGIIRRRAWRRSLRS